MAVWEIRCYRNERGRDLFCEAYREQTARARARFRTLINGLLHQVTIEGWSRANGFDMLTGKKYRRYHGLGKVRVRVGVEHRPLGFFGPSAATFTLLMWATERDGEFDPPTALETALHRMRAVQANPGLAHECDF
jgi:hypothetical protein